MLVTYSQRKLDFLDLVKNLCRKSTATVNQLSTFYRIP